MGTRSPSARTASLRGSNGFSLIELVVVLAVLGMCLAASIATLTSGLSRQGGRGAAQDWQATAAWAQVGVLWHGGDAAAGYGCEGLAASHSYELCGGDLGSTAPSVSVSANVTRWIDVEGVSVSFGGSLASPNGGGSLYFHASQSSYRVIVRPESGLTVRSWVQDAP